MIKLIKKNQCPTPATNWDRWCISLQRYPLHHRWILNPEMQTIIIEYDIRSSKCIICIWRHIHMYNMTSYMYNVTSYIHNGYLYLTSHGLWYDVILDFVYWYLLNIHFNLHEVTAVWYHDVRVYHSYSSVCPLSRKFVQLCTNLRHSDIMTSEVSHTLSHSN